MICSSFVELSSPYFHPAKSNADLVRVKLALSDISAGRVGGLVDQLMQLSDTRLAVDRWRSKLIIGVERSGTELRDASEILEVVYFFRQLTAQWPFWLHFVEKECGTMGAVLRLLIGTERIRQTDGSNKLMLTDADAVRSQTKRLYMQMKNLYRCHGLDETEDLKMVISVTKAVNAMFQKSRDNPER